MIAMHTDQRSAGKDTVDRVANRCLVYLGGSAPPVVYPRGPDRGLRFSCLAPRWTRFVLAP